MLLLERTELQRIERLRMFLQLRTAIGGTRQKQACVGTDVAQTKDLREKTGDLGMYTDVDWREVPFDGSSEKSSVL